MVGGCYHWHSSLTVALGMVRSRDAGHMVHTISEMRMVHVVVLAVGRLWWSSLALPYQRDSAIVTV